MMGQWIAVDEGLTNAVSSCGLEISPGLAAAECFVGVLAPDATSDV